MKKLLVFALLLPCLVQGETLIKTLGVSTHLRSDHTTNNFHRVAMIQHDSFIGGYFRNSFDDDAYALGYSVYQSTGSVVRFYVHAGLVYGYRGKCVTLSKEPTGNDRLVCPFIAPELMAHKLPLKPSLSLLGDAMVLTLNITL